MYKKTFINGIEVFEFSNNPEDELYNVRFSLVGNTNGNYILTNSQAIGRIYEYVAPIAGIPQGNYEPIIRLVAPTKIQIATIVSTYSPTEKTKIETEIAISNNDQNLFSSVDDANNQGIASKLNDNQAGMRAVIQFAVQKGLPVAGLMNSLAYFDAYRSANLPTNLIQAQRDYFGAHTYERIDKAGVFHTQWAE